MEGIELKFNFKSFVWQNEIIDPKLNLKIVRAQTTHVAQSLNTHIHTH